jgi:hypothetical protein
MGVIHGEHVLLRSENSDPPSKAAFFCSPTLMRLVEPVLSVRFTQAGWSGRGAGFFLSFLRGVQLRAEQITSLPDDMQLKPGLLAQHFKAVAAALQAAALQRRSSMSTPLSDQQGDAIFVSPGSAGEVAITELDDDIRSVLRDLRLSPRTGDQRVTRRSTMWRRR